MPHYEYILLLDTIHHNQPDCSSRKPENKWKGSRRCCQENLGKPCKVRRTLDSFFTVNYKYNQKEESIWGFFFLSMFCLIVLKIKMLVPFGKLKAERLKKIAPEGIMICV